MDFQNEAQASGSSSNNNTNATYHPPSDFHYDFSDSNHSPLTYPHLRPPVPPILPPAPALPLPHFPSSHPQDPAPSLPYPDDSAPSHPKRAKIRASPHLPAEKNMAIRAAEIAANCPDPGRDASNRFKCPYPSCDKAFLRRYNLKVHARKHTNETPYSCKIPLCGKKFKWRSSMAHHQKSHNTKKKVPNNARKNRINNHKTVPVPPNTPNLVFRSSPNPDMYENRSTEGSTVAFQNLPPACAEYAKGCHTAFPSSPVSSMVNDSRTVHVHTTRPIVGPFAPRHNDLHSKFGAPLNEAVQTPRTIQTPLPIRSYMEQKKEYPIEYDFDSRNEMGFGDFGYPTDHIHPDQLPGEHLDNFMQGDFITGHHN